ncbi:hypothetical protein RCS94_02575 [Orbaceae bacterium ac157xtp]
MFTITLFSIAHAALSAVSMNVIEGRAPVFKGYSGADKLGFTVRETKYSEAIGNIKGDVEEVFEPSLRLNEFEINTLISNDFNIETDYYDEDGDEPHSMAPFTMGVLSYEWIERDGTKITDLNKMVGCSGLSLPLKLKITLPKVQAQSMYGLPKYSESVTLTKEYKITTKTGICFAKPNSTDVHASYQWANVSGGAWDWNGRNTAPNIIFGGGYNSDYEPNYGFRASAVTKFPTTGFVGGKFQLVMVGLQTDYTFTRIANPSSSVTVDANGYVTLNSKPSGPVTIRARLNADSSIVHDYVFNPTKVWAIPKLGYGDYEWAKIECGTESAILTRVELSNSPQKTATNLTLQYPNAHTRAINGGVFGEWGHTDNDSYPASQWGNFWYWTKDEYTDSAQFIVYSDVGPIHWGNKISRFNVACRG